MVNSAYNVQVFCHLKARRWSDFYASPVLPYREDEQESNVFSSIYRFTLRGFGHLQQLQADAAWRNLQEARQLGLRHTGAQSLPTALPCALLARLHYERLEFEQATQMLDDRLRIIPASGFGDVIHAAYSIGARLEYRQGNVERANEILEQASSTAHGMRLVHLELAMLHERERLLLRSGRLWEAQACLKRIEQLAAAPHPDADVAAEIEMIASLARAHLDLAESRASAAGAAFQHWQDWATAHGSYLLALDCTASLAVALHAAGNNDAAYAALSKYFELAGPTGFKATLLDAAPDVQSLLESYRSTTAARALSAPAASLLRAMATPDNEPLAPAVFAAGTVLSPRERDILALIAQDKSNKEISRLLNIAPETVKTHVKHIFGKLEVNKRTHAVTRALSLRLLPPL
nr:LuxR C-terminal-related transcriptional regulator [Burkholderia vietnamiensis]